jgi:hypothetical protein
VLVGRAVERADRARRAPAAGIDRLGEQHQLGAAVRLAVRLELGLEGVLDVFHDELDEIDQLLVGVAAGRRLRLIATGRRRTAYQAAHVDPEEPRDQHHDHRRDERSAGHLGGAHSSASLVDHVLVLGPGSPLHNVRVLQ